MLNLQAMRKNKDGGAKKVHAGAALLRVQKDITELDLPSTMKTHFPNPEDELNFLLVISPNEGMYRDGTFKFSFAIPASYPHEPPKVRCTQTVYHPNIDLEGNVCLNMLREDWKPVLSLNAVAIGLQYLFLDPNPDDPLNKEAATDLRASREQFLRTVALTMKGGSFKGQDYDNVMKPFDPTV